MMTTPLQENLSIDETLQYAEMPEILGDHIAVIRRLSAHIDAQTTANGRLLYQIAELRSSLHRVLRGLRHAKELANIKADLAETPDEDINEIIVLLATDIHQLETICETLSTISEAICGTLSTMSSEECKRVPTK